VERLLPMLHACNSRSPSNCTALTPSGRYMEKLTGRYPPTSLAGTLILESTEIKLGLMPYVPPRFLLIFDSFDLKSAWFNNWPAGADTHIVPAALFINTSWLQSPLHCP
jgi:hypothetical protein